MKKENNAKTNPKDNKEIKYYPNAKIKCSCGNILTVGSTVPEMEIEICSACHPYYTGQKKVVDTAGRVERFRKRFEKISKKNSKKSQKVN